MAGIDEKFIEELKNRNNIIDVVSKYCVLKRKGSNYWACCPLPGHNEKTPSFTVNEHGQFYHCFGCSKGGDVIKFIEEVESLDFYESVKYLADLVKMPVPENNNYNEEQTIQNKKKKDRLYSLLKDTALHYVTNLNTKEGEKALNYLEKRRLNANTVRAFGLGASVGYNELPNYLKTKGYTEEEMLQAGVCQRSEKGNLFDAEANRVIVPIINNLGKVIAFGGRVLEKTSDNIGKYKNTQETQIFSKKKTLFAINNLKKLKNEGDIKEVIIVEGYMDAISLYQAGFKNVVASMGTSLTIEQAKLLKRYTDKVIVSFDGDIAGQKATLRSLSIFEDEGFDIRILSLPNGKDPDDVIKHYGKEGYQALIDKADPLIDFKLKALSFGKNLKDASDRRKYVFESLEFIKSVKDAFLREELLKKLRDVSGLSFESLKRDLENGTTFIEEDEVSFKEPIIKSDKNERAERFIISCYIYNKHYADVSLLEDIYFSNEIRSKIADSIIDGSLVKIDALANFVGENGLKELDLILIAGENIFKQNYEEKYFLDCVQTIKKSNLEDDIKKLNEAYTKESDLEKRREIANVLLKKTKKLTEV